MSKNKRETWGSLIVGILLLVFACYIYVEITHWETYGGTIRMPKLMIGVYKLLGVWGVSSFFAIVGGWLVVRGFLKMKKTDDPQEIK